jgi:magnesium chelatase subunit D
VVVVAPGSARRLAEVPRRATDRVADGRRAPAPEGRGRFVRAVPAGDDVADLAVAQSAMAVAERRASDPDAPVTSDDLRAAVRQGTTANLVIVAVDTSSSMGAEQRIAATKGAVLGLLTDAYQQRDRVALIAFRGERAEVVLRPTGSVEVARARLAELPVGGATPLAAGLDAVRDLAERAARARELAPVVVLVTDGRATAGGDTPLAEAKAAATRLAELGAPTLVVDAEDPAPPRLGLADELAALLGARCVPLGELDTATIRTLTA